MSTGLLPRPPLRATRVRPTIAGQRWTPVASLSQRPLARRALGMRKNSPSLHGRPQAGQERLQARGVHNVALVREALMDVFETARNCRPSCPAARGVWRGPCRGLGFMSILVHGSGRADGVGPTSRALLLPSAAATCSNSRTRVDFCTVSCTLWNWAQLPHANWAPRNRTGASDGCRSLAPSRAPWVRGCTPSTLTQEGLAQCKISTVPTRCPARWTPGTPTPPEHPTCHGCHRPPRGHGPRLTASRGD